MPTASCVWTGRPVRRNMRASSTHARALAATTSTWNIQAGAPTVNQTNAGIRTTALAIRRQAAGTPARSRTITSSASSSLTSYLPEPARAALKLGHRAIEVAGAEVGPHDGREHQLGVGDLPQEKIRDPHLAARADQEVRIRDVGGVEGPADVFLRDVVGFEVAGLDLARQRAERVEQLIAASVVEGHHHGQSGVVPRLVHDVIDAAPHAGRHALRTTEDAKPSVS